MREIVLEGKTYETTRQMVDALAWATNRRGRVEWKDSVNVVLPIMSYLDTNNVDISNANHKGHGRGGGIRYVIEKLVKQGFAEITFGANKSITTFKFKDDVILSGHMPNFKKVEETLKPQPANATAHFDEPGSEGFVIPDMPLPPAPKPPRYLADNINAGLDMWAERDADSYAKWAETLLERLGALYG